MRDAFFSPKFSKCVKYFSLKNHNAHALFRQFSDVDNGKRSKQPSFLSQLVTGESQCTGISCPKES